MQKAKIYDWYIMKIMSLVCTEYIYIFKVWLRTKLTLVMSLSPFVDCLKTDLMLLYITTFASSKFMPCIFKSKLIELLRQSTLFQVTQSFFGYSNKVITLSYIIDFMYVSAEEVIVSNLLWYRKNVLRISTDFFWMLKMGL